MFQTRNLLKLIEMIKFLILLYANFHQKIIEVIRLHVLTPRYCENNTTKVKGKIILYNSESSKYDSVEIKEKFWSS